MTASPRHLGDAMRRAPLSLVSLLTAVLLATVLAAPAGADASVAAAAPPATNTGWTAAPQLGPDDLTLTNTQHLSDRLTQLTFTTPALSSATRVRVLVPKGYDTSGTTRYPVLYLLHGGGGSYLDWTDKGAAAAITADYPVIVVMPDTGPGNGYMNWYNNGAFGPPMWETYHIDQLLPWIDGHYRTIATRAERAIAGLSMGGGGAVGYAARHPDLFSSTAGFSGAVDTNVPLVWPLADQPDANGHINYGMGLRLTDEIRWRDHNPWDIAENLRGTSITLKSGNGLPGGPDGGLGDPIEAGVHMMNVNLDHKLTALGIAHVWDDYGPGGHNWYYWQRDLRQLLPPLMELFANPTPAPSAYTYRTADPTYSLWGWNVHVARTHLEFSELRDANRDGFTLTGSGRGEVTTAGYYQPGQRLTVTTIDRTGTHRTTAQADAQGRLHTSVDLGPANPYQEYSAQGRLWVLLQTAGGLPGTVFSNPQWPSQTATVRITPVAP
ncbi:MAG TPA: alpha/beta hydrolase family protein [Acidimicrobiales bacterium]|jgi:S-formylglutathione hydrolase FrmB|nr:alpha/beta hydrolase family protein [Acidimicrobiales bacterium]